MPLLPKHIGVVTSPTGAAIQDILNVLERRYKAAQITVIPARVQGEGAAQEVARGIDLANAVGGFDVLIVGRGGGSIEDLWCFNEEIVARSIFKSSIPIISAVGHEIDYTIADFVADYRAPTPSAAAEVVAKSVVELTEKISNIFNRMNTALQYRLSNLMQKMMNLQSRLVDPKRRLEDLAIQCDDLFQRLQAAVLRNFREKNLQVRVLHGKIKNPQEVLSHKKNHVTQLAQRLQKEIRQLMNRNKNELAKNISLLNSLSPLLVMERGYSIVFKEDKVIRSVKDIRSGEELRLRFGDGGADVKVTEILSKDVFNK